MVKPDYTRDYYAALEVSPNCTEDDIKRQFRKLALIYHPDRNPGKELEYNPRFQAIQEAHEVLGDPEQRAKYDFSRKRGTVNNTFARPAPPRRNNPYQATSNFPPPPRRTNPRTTSDFPPPPKGSGAERYARWTGPPPPQRERQSTAQDAREKANAFSAWQAMNNAQKTQPKQQQQPQQHQQRFSQGPPPPFPPRQRPVPTPPETPAGGAAKPRTTSNGSPPRPAYGEAPAPQPGMYRTTSGHGQPLRRTAFDPTTPNESERPSSGPTMYTSAPRYDRDVPPASKVPNFHPPPPPAPTPPLRAAAPTARRPDPRSQFRAGSQDDLPIAEGAAKVQTPYPANVGDKIYVNPEKLQRANSYRDPPHFSPPSREPHLHPGGDPMFERRRSVGSDASDAHTNGNTGQRQPMASTQRPWLVESSSEESDDDSSSAPPRPPKTRTASQDNGSVASSNLSQDGTAPQNRPKAQPTSRARRFAEQESASGGWGPAMQNSSQPGMPRGGPTSAFTFPLKSDTFARTSNPELRGQAFAQDDANFSPTDTRDEDTHLPRTESHPNMYAFRGAQQDLGASAPPPPSGDGAFHADKWTRDIQEDNWASKWADAPGTQTSPTKNVPNTRRQRGSGSRTATRSNTAKTPITPQPASVEEEENGDPRNFTGATRAESPDSNAMDIDSETPPMERKPSIMVEDTALPQQQPRAVHVEPSRPEWANGASLNGRFDRRPSLPNNITSGPLPQGKDPRISPQLSMDSLRGVAPFSKPSPSGLSGMNDLSADLPFASQPSATSPLVGLEAAEEPNSVLPKPPKPPLIPQKCTETNWAFYVERMYAYLSAWHDFNNAMIEHFERRHSELRDFEKNNTGIGTATKDGSTGIVHGWLGAVGETRELKGWDTYVAEMKDDQRWRTHWNVACDKHATAIEAHANVRRRILNGEMAM